MAREAIESLEGVRNLRMCGTRATFTLAQDHYFDGKALAKAIEAKKLDLVGFRMEYRSRAALAWRIRASGLG